MTAVRLEPLAHVKMLTRPHWNAANLFRNYGFQIIPFLVFGFWIGYSSFYINIVIDIKEFSNNNCYSYAFILTKEKDVQFFIYRQCQLCLLVCDYLMSIRSVRRELILPYNRGLL